MPEKKDIFLIYEKTVQMISNVGISETIKKVYEP